jgi:hypothetical protein
MWHKLTPVCFALLWLFVGGSSTLDAFLTIKYADSMYEENPIGLALIQLGPAAMDRPQSVGAGVQDVSLFVGIKMFGTILVLGILIVLYQAWRPGAQLAAAGLSLFQFGLLLYIFQ